MGSGPGPVPRFGPDFGPGPGPDPKPIFLGPRLVNLTFGWVPVNYDGRNDG